MARGDRLALNQLYRRHAPWVAGRLQRATSSVDLAEEALQDTFLAAWKGAGRFRGQGDVGAWLWGIARRRLVSLTRRSKISVEGPPEVPGPAADEIVLHREEATDVRAAVANLPGHLREAIETVVFGDVPLAEAAVMLGIPTGTLKSRLHRARAQLRIEMEQR